MTQSTRTAPVVVYATTPLTCLGLVQFIRQLAVNTHRVLPAPSLTQLQQQLYHTHVCAVVAELSGSADTQTDTVAQLLALSAQYPALNIVVYTASRDVTLLAPLRSRRQFSLIAQQETPAQLRLDMTQALTGNPVCSPALAQCFSAQDRTQGHPVLTPTECHILHYLYDGLSLMDIAALQRRSVKTISAHKRNVMRKLGARSDAELFQHPPDRVTQADHRTRV